jgi:hypothetical protein
METGICYKYFATFSIISYDTLKKSANQKQELPMVAMFVNGSGQN